MNDSDDTSQSPRPLPSKKQKIGCLTLFIAAIIIGIIIGLSMSTGNGGSASTPLGVYEAAKIGMTLDSFQDKIDSDYANGSCWLIECSSLSGGAGTIKLTATSTFEAPYYAYVFMPVFSEAQPTIVGFNGSTDTLIAYGRVDYDSAYVMVLSYGSRTFW